MLICSEFTFAIYYIHYLKRYFVFPLEIVLSFTGRRRSSVDPDRALQEALRTRLRVVESNSQDVIQLFKVSDSRT